jgi:hypothetical protein
MARLGHVALMAAIVAGLLTSWSATVVAECTGLDPWPSFTTAVPSARSVFVGTVTDTPGDNINNRFTLRVDEVLRGRAPAEIEFVAFKSGMPLSICPSDSILRVRTVGDRLAFAMDARMPGVPRRIDAVAFIGDSRPHRFLMPEIERLPLRTVRRLAEREPDGSDARRPYPVGPDASGLVARRVAPGVGRIVERFTGRDLDDVRFLAIDQYGTPWAGTQTEAFRFDWGSRFDRGDGLPRRLTGLTPGDDARILAEGWGPLAVFHRGHWTRLEDGELARVDVDHPIVTGDGTIWAVAERGVARHDADGWTHFGWRTMDPPCRCAEPPLGDGSCTCWVSGLAEAPDGGIWAGLHGTEGLDPIAAFEGGLLRFDGETWSAAPPPVVGGAFAITDLLTASDGSIWASVLPARPLDADAADQSSAFLARWDGSTWTSYMWPSWLRARQRDPIHQMVAGPVGSVWFTEALTSFDGMTWRQYAVPGRARSERPRVFDLAVAPEGTAWIVVRDVVKFRTSRPDGIYVIDPAQAQPVATEAVTVVGSSPEPGP